MFSEDFKNKQSLDMATTTKNTNIIPEFEGKPDQDVLKWTKRAAFVINLYNFTPDEAFKTIFKSLRGDAFVYDMDWCTERPDDGEIAPLFQALESRFTGKLFLLQIANKFQTDEIPQSITEYFAMLNGAKFLHDRGYMSLEAVSHKIIQRSPPEIRTVLWAKSNSIRNIFELSIQAESIIPLAYGSNGSIAKANEVLLQANAVNNSSMRQQDQKFCLIHGNGSHDSKSCKLIQKERNRFNERKSAKTSDSRHKSFSEINSFEYSSCKIDTVNFKNPFRTEGIINSDTRTILIDTGADKSFAHISVVKKLTTRPTAEKAISANGSPITITGAIQNTSVVIKGHKIILPKLLITKDKLNSVIIGADAIKANPEILLDIIQNIKVQHQSTKTIAEVDTVTYTYASIRKLIETNENLFGNNISPSSVCSYGEHRIELANTQPCKQRNYRIPIHWEPEIEKEIQKLKKAGAIKLPLVF